MGIINPDMGMEVNDDQPPGKVEYTKSNQCDSSDYKSSVVFLYRTSFLRQGVVSHVLDCLAHTGNN